MRLCKFPGCGQAHRAKGYCSGHYRMWLQHQPLRPIKRHQPSEYVKPPAQSPWTGSLKNLMENAPRWSGKKGSHK